MGAKERIRRSARRGAVVAGVAALAVGPLTVIAPSAIAAAALPTATVGVTPSSAKAGQTFPALAFGFANRLALRGTVSLQVPAGFTPPQTTQRSKPGYVAVVSSCQQFTASAVQAGPSGSTVVRFDVNCKALNVAGVAIGQEKVPTTGGTYPFPVTYTPTGSATAQAIAPTPTVTVKAAAPGPLAALTITPATASITSGGSQVFTVTGKDAAGNSLGDVTNGTTFTIAPNGSCTLNSCTATSAGAHTVTATNGTATTTASLDVTPATTVDLSIGLTAQSLAPTYGTNDTFTATVTNHGNGTANGVTAMVALPDGLTFYGTDGNYEPTTGAWSIGSLASGASAVLHLQATAGHVAIGDRTVSGSVSTAGDTESTNNTAAVTVHSTRASLKATIKPDVTNPPALDVFTSVGLFGWNAVAATTPGTVIPSPSFWASWTCTTDSGHPCPDAAGLSLPDSRHVEWDASAFPIASDVVRLELVVEPNGEDDWTPSYDVIEIPVTASGQDGSSGASFAITPATATIAAGGSQTYTATMTDGGGGVGDVTDQATFRIGPDGSCTANVCTATVPGSHAVTIGGGVVGALMVTG